MATSFSLKQGETRTSHGPIPHPLSDGFGEPLHACLSFLLPNPSTGKKNGENINFSFINTCKNIVQQDAATVHEIYVNLKFVNIFLFTRFKFIYG